MKNYIILVFFLLLTSCSRNITENDLYGFYVPTNYKYSYDTIRLKAFSVYHRKIYDNNKKLLMDMQGKWVLEKGNIIRFNSFFLNLDSDLKSFPYKVNDTTMELATQLEIDNNNIIFYVGYYEGQCKYARINDDK